MNLHVIGVGEVLWDLLPAGPQLGGAPANFAYHTRALGTQAQVITRVGNDNRGREIIRRFRAMGLPANSIQVDDSAPTGTAHVDVSSNGLAHFTIQDNVAWDHLAATEEAITAAASADAICFGSLAQRSEPSRQAIQRLVAATPTRALRVFDINLRQRFYSRDVIDHSLRFANVLKVNDDELPILAEMFHLEASPEHQMESLARTYDLHLVALTRGAKGSLLFQKHPQERWSACEPTQVKVVDTVGAGDSFTAALAMGLLRKMDLDEINRIANAVAQFVCTQAGATPTLPDSLAAEFSVSDR